MVQLVVVVFVGIVVVVVEMVVVVVMIVVKVNTKSKGTHCIHVIFSSALPAPVHLQKRSPEARKASCTRH